MKSAEDWIIDMLSSSAPFGGQDGVHAIQADALRHAAELCERVRPDVGQLEGTETDYGMHLAVSMCVKIIANESDKLTHEQNK